MSDDEDELHEVTIDEMTFNEIKDYVEQLKSNIKSLEMMPYMKEDDLDDLTVKVENMRQDLARAEDEHATDILYKEKLQDMLDVDHSGSDTHGSWDDIVRAINDLTGKPNDDDGPVGDPNCELCHGQYYLPDPPGVSAGPLLECPRCKGKHITKMMCELKVKSTKVKYDNAEIERLQTIIDAAIKEATDEFFNDQQVMNIVKEVYGIDDDYFISQKSILTILQRRTT